MSQRRIQTNTKHSSNSSTSSIYLDISAIQKILLEWGENNYRSFPWRETNQQWKGLIAEILLQRTKVSSVLKVYEEFFQKFSSPNALASATVEEIEKAIFPLGLHWRAPLLRKLGEYLVQTESKIPYTLKELVTLPGVGQYVASAWLSFHGNIRSVLIDANIVRWLCRLIDQKYDGETRRKKWLIDLADEITPKEKWREFNFSVLDFTMTICTPRNPQCFICPIGSIYCAYGRRILNGTPTENLK